MEVVVDSVKEKFHCFDDITLETPSSYFSDIPEDIAEFQGDIESFDLGRLISTTKKHFMPSVLYLWGCTEYIHKYGYVSMDSVIQRFMRKSCLSMSNDHSTYTFIESAREDYLRNDVDDYEFHLYNPDWTPRPCIAFAENRGRVDLSSP